MRKNNLYERFDRSALGFRAWTGRLSGMAGAHRHGDFELNAVGNGRVSYLLAGRGVALEPGDVGLFWAALPHRTLSDDSLARPEGPGATAGVEVTMGWLLLPVSWSLTVLDASVPRTALLEGAVLVLPGAAEAVLSSIRVWRGWIESGDARWERVARLEIEAMLRKMMLSGPVVRGVGAEKLANAEADGGSRGHASGCRRGRGGDRQGGGDRAGLDAVHAMAAFISRRFRDPISTADVAGHVHLHPTYAMRVFKRHLDTTINGYITRHRVAEAQRLLLIGDEGVASIGYAAGFGSTSRFHEAFLRQVGSTPSRYRRANR